ncbi:hypothetical protein TRICI_005715 [Trichomonascus ciferrii]|uniref:Lipocalin-like domain-containing protein n=1 Tax=Trichomonascus ciferrii TaxID=44093 RepID=A0A642UQ91_9ASCO|nr:hypothetical protein TRICI_005715 [Trichomonascus ciferrii]
MKISSLVVLTAVCLGFSSADAPPDYEFDLQIESDHGEFDGQWVVAKEVEGKMVGVVSPVKGEPFYGGSDPAHYIAFDQTVEGGYSYYSTLEDFKQSNDLVFLSNVLQISTEKHITYSGDRVFFEGVEDFAWSFCDDKILYVDQNEQCTNKATAILHIVPR